MDVGMDVQFPVFLVARDGRATDVRSFSSLEAMESYLEPIDIEDDEYLGWDADGVALRFKVDASGGGRHWLKVISTGVMDREGLCESITRHALRLGIMVETEDECLPVDLLRQVKFVEAEQRRLKRHWWQFWK